MRTQFPVRLFRSEVMRTTYFEVIPEGFTLDKVLTGDYWTHVRKMLRLYDLFELVAADGSFDALVRLVYLNNVNGELRFRILSNVTSNQAPAYIPAASNRFVVQHRGGGRFAVVEKATGERLVDGVPKADAEEAAAAAEAGRVPA